MDLITPSGGLLLWMTLIFALVFFLLAKFGFPVITSGIRKRSDRISKSLEEARQIEEKVSRMQESCDKMLGETRMEQEKMLEEAREASRKMLEEAKARAGAEADKILSDAREELRKQQEDALRQAGNIIAEMSIAVSEKILREKLSSEERQKLLSDKLLPDMEEKFGKMN